MKQVPTFKPYLVLLFVLWGWVGSNPAQPSTISINALVVNTQEDFSFYVTAKQTVDLKSYIIRLYLPIETVTKIHAIEAVQGSYTSFVISSAYDTSLKSVVWTVQGELSQPLQGDVILFKVNARASSNGGYSTIGVAVTAGELLGSFVQGGSIYVLEPNWPWYDLQINYKNAFHRLDFDNSGLVDRNDLILFNASWHQRFSTDLPAGPTPTPTPAFVEPTPTPKPDPIPSIEEFLGTWTFDFLHNTLIGINVHIVFNATLTDDGAMLIEGRYNTQFLGNYTYDEGTGKINGVFSIITTSLLNPTQYTTYFVNFEGETGIGNSLNGSATFTYNSTDIKIGTYESQGLTISDPGHFTGVKE